jgi:hypothetical protein
MPDTGSRFDSKGRNTTSQWHALCPKDMVFPDMIHCTYTFSKSIQMVFTNTGNRNTMSC